MIKELLFNINIWSAFLGLLGSILIFFFGLPPNVNPSGLVGLALEQENEEEKKRGKQYKQLSYIGLFFLILCFLLQFISSVKTSLNY